MGSLRGQLLVAGPALDDPNFRRTVLLVGEHGEDGAMGVVLNRPTSVTVAEAVPPLASLAEDERLVHLGGPVQPQAVVVLADFVDPTDAAGLVFDTVGFLPARSRTRTTSARCGRSGCSRATRDGPPVSSRSELEDGSWLVLPARASDIFSVEPDGLWREVLRRQGGALAVLALLPDDPRVN